MIEISVRPLIAQPYLRSPPLSLTLLSLSLSFSVTLTLYVCSSHSLCLFVSVSQLPAARDAIGTALETAQQLPEGVASAMQETQALLAEFEVVLAQQSASVS